MTGYRALARNHDFTALWVGQTVSELGSRISMFCFPLLTYALTGSAGLAAAAEALHLLGLVGVLLPAGALADRVDRRRVMRTASAAGVLLYGSLVVAAAVGTLTVPHLFVVALLTGVAAGVFSPAEVSAVRDVVSTEELPTALSQNQARQHVAGLIGAPVGGALYGLAPWLPFAVDAVSFALSWLLLGRIRTDLSPTRREASSPVRDVVDGLRFVWARPFLRTLMVWSTLTNLVSNAILFVVILRLVRAGFDPVHIGLVETVSGIAGIAGAIAAPWLIERIPTGALSVTIAWSFVPMALPLALWNNPTVAAACMVTWLVLNPAGNAGIGAYKVTVTPRELLGRVQSSGQFVSMALLPLAPVLAGVTLSLWGGATAVAVLGVAAAGVALIPTLARSVRSVPRPAVWRAEAQSSTTVPGAPLDSSSSTTRATSPGGIKGESPALV